MTTPQGAENGTDIVAGIAAARADIAERVASRVEDRLDVLEETLARRLDGIEDAVRDLTARLANHDAQITAQGGVVVRIAETEIEAKRAKIKFLGTLGVWLTGPVVTLAIVNLLERC